MQTRIVKYLLILLLSTMPVLAQDANQAVKNAWQYWTDNDQLQAEKSFKEALKLDNSNLRAHLGLSFLYQMQYNYKLSWKHYKYVLENTTNPYPYIFSGMHTPKIIFNQNDKKSGIQDIYESLAEQNDNALMKANGNEALGRYYLLHNDLDEAIEYFNALNTIDDWRLIGPFDNISASGFDKVFPPEYEVEYDKTYDGKNGIPANWVTISKLRHDRWVDFRLYYAHFEAVFYGNTFVFSPAKGIAQIRVGTSGSLKIFLNDDTIYEVFDENNNDLDTYIVEAELQQGWNRLLIKCGFSEINQCNFLVRITDTDGQPIENLKISSETQSYPVKPNPPVKVINNFAEEYYLQKIKENPQEIENYFLLADCYLRNDKAIEAELSLKNALEYAPDNTGVLSHLIEAYIRGEKNDEVSTTYEKMYALDSNIPAVLEYKFARYHENENVEKAERIINKLNNLIPNSPKLYQLYFQFYSLKKLPEKLIELSEEGYKEYPDNWGLAFGQATILTLTTQKYDGAIKILERFSEHTAEEQVLSTLAKTYLRASQLKDWEKTYERILELYPAGTGFYNQMVQVYYQLQNYKKAEEYIKMALGNCSSHSDYWQTYGQILRTLDNKTVAIDAYVNSLKYNPANFESREGLRQLREQPSIFARFENIDRDSLIKNAPDSKAYPEDGAVILLHDMKRVVYPQGASEYQGEELVRVFNDDGIDDFKEDYISFSPYNEKLIVEKAVVIKPDGSEISADINHNHIVYKSLEANDFIYLKWKIRNLYNGKLSRHFWDRIIFSRYYPVEDISYALLIPENIEFNFSKQNLDDVRYQKRKPPEGFLHQWKLVKQPAVRYESGMPDLADIGKTLYISSIEDWKYLVDWYTDLARTKTRSSFEVREIVQELFKDKQDLSDLDKVQIVYNYITETIKYSSVSFRQSGLIPQKARNVLVNRIGDCKDVATLCISMLNELDIKSNYVLVNTRNEGLNRNILPGIEFNHAIVEVHTGEQSLYLDLTAKNYAVGSVPRQDLEAFVLPIRENVDQPFYLAKSNFTPSGINRKTTIDIHPDNGISITRVNYRTGLQAAGFRNSYRFKGETDRRRKLTESISNDFPNVRLDNLTIENVDSIVNDITYIYNFSVPNFLTDAGPYKILKVPFTDDASARKALSYEKRVYPYLYWPSTDVLKENLTITLPTGFSLLELPKAVHLNYQDMEYSLSFTKKGNSIIIDRVFKESMKEITPEQYEEFKKFYNAVVKADQTQLLIREN